MNRKILIWVAVLLGASLIEIATAWWSPPIGDIDRCITGDFKFEDVAESHPGFDYWDVISLYDNMEDFRSKNWTTYYDFNDDDNLDFYDVLILAHKLYDYGEIDTEEHKICAIPPTDLDKDGIAEDIDGDGKIGIRDAIACCICGWCNASHVMELIPPKIPGFPYPYDIDGDLKFEDMNGDEKLTIADVVVFHDNLDWIKENWRDKADFNGDGVVDIKDVEELFKEFESSVKMTNFTINLTVGHNYVSIPLKLIVNVSVFGEVEAWEWDAQNQSWKRVYQLEPGKGYYIYSLKNVSVTLRGEPYRITPEVLTAQLKEGWNLVGVGIDAIRARDIYDLSEDMWFTYYGSNTSVGYDMLIFDGKDFLGSTELLQPGKAYWIKVYTITKTK